MGWANKLIGWATGNGVEVDANNRLLVNLAQGSTDPDKVGGVRVYSEVDTGLFLPGGTAADASLVSPEADNDYRLRVSQDTFLDEETFDTAAQNTGKHTFTSTTLAATWTTAAFTTNSGSIITTTTGCALSTYATFGLLGTSTLAVDIEAAFSALPVANTVIDFGLFARGAANPFAPSDGAYFRLTSAGLQGVVCYNGVETTTSVFNFTYTPNQKYQFIVYISRREVEFWINTGASTDLYGELATPSGNGQPMASASLPFSIRHAIVGGAAGGVLQGLFSAYNIRLGSGVFTPSLGATGNRLYGSYQGLSGGTMGSLASYPNSTNPVAAVPTNTTAALGTGLGGQFWETFTLAVNTDGIICSYQNPVGGVNQPPRRLVINGIALSSYIQTVLAGGPCNTQYALAFGHTALSLATAEAAATKAPRRIPLPQLTQTITAAQAVNTIVAQNNVFAQFTNPIYVNPGEFVALVAKHVGTVGTSGTIAHVVAFDYGWE